jgi:hypothetical protein
MSFFTQQTVTVQIDAENSAVVRKLTYAESQSVKSKATSVSVSKAHGERMTIDPFVMQSAMLRVALVSWSGPGFDGRPVTVENIDALPAAVADKLAAAADALNQEPGEDEKKA